MNSTLQEAKEKRQKYRPELTTETKEPEFEDPTEEQQSWYNKKYPNDPANREQKDKKPIQEDKKPVEEVTELLMKYYNFATIQESEEILVYQNGVYVNEGEIVIEKYAEEYLGYSLNNSQIAEIKGHIRRRTYHKREEFDADINIINLKNGLYDIQKNQLFDPDPNYLSLNQKPIVYDKKAKSKLFSTFLKQVLYPHEIRTALEAMAYTFHRDYELEYIFILFGLGANGKSVFTSILTALHGRRNVSNVTISHLLKNTYALSNLENKDVNIDSEAIGYISNTAVLKRLTGGSKQPIRVEEKFKKAYDTILHAKLFLNANKMPVIEDLTNADSRRFVIITFPNEFDGSKADPKLVSKLTTEEELSGIFNVLMTYLRGILKNESIYLNEKTIEERRQKYERTSYPIKSFIKEAVLDADDIRADSYVTKQDFYNAYLQYCKKYGLPAEKFETLSKEVNKLNSPEDIEYHIDDKRIMINKEKVRIWTGISLKPEYIKYQDRLLEDLR